MTTYPLAWPAALRFRRLNFNLDARSRSGGPGLSGVELPVASPSGRWVAEGVLPFNVDERVRVYRALKVRLRGRAGTVALPVFDRWGPALVTGLGFDDLTLFDDDTGFDDGVVPAVLASGAARGATTLQIDTDEVPIQESQYFSIGTRLYFITEVLSRVGEVSTVTIEPPLRVAASSGAALNFANPVCEMRLAADDSGALDLDLNRFGTANLSFVEVL